MSSLFDAIIRGSIKHRYLVLVGALALVALGVWSATSARLDALPNFTPPIVIVQAEAPGDHSSPNPAVASQTDDGGVDSQSSQGAFDPCLELAE